MSQFMAFWKYCITWVTSLQEFVVFWLRELGVPSGEWMCRWAWRRAGDKLTRESERAFAQAMWWEYEEG